MSRQDSKQIGDVKVMLVKGDNGSDIEKIEKTGTDGLIDTYTVTLTDGTKNTFTVTNGSSIEKIEKTGTDGLIDTYTVTLTNGNTSTFTVTNGRGITKIEKTSTERITDTYTITYNDGTTSTFDVINADVSAVYQNFAYVESTNKASKAYASGDFLVYDGQLYKVKTAIASGATLIDGTNIETDNAGNELATISRDVSWYATSSTGASTQAKVATTTDSKFTLVTGAKVKVKFTNTNTHATPTLNVDSKGAKSIKAYGTTAPSLWWNAGDVVEFTYDGTNWVMGATEGQILNMNETIGSLSSLKTENKTNLVSATNEVNDMVDMLSGWAGKNILIIGDSISDEALYPNCWVKNFKTMCSQIGATVTNYSLQGRTIGIYSGATNYLMNIVGNIPSGSYDEIVVFLGANDWLNQVSLGKIGDTNNNSVIKNIESFRTWVKTNYPNALVTFITPLKAKMENDIKHKLTQMYATAIVTGALWSGFGVIDAHSYAPLINDNAISDWTIDGLHPKDAYAPYLARYIFNNLISKVRSIGLNNYKTRLAIGDVSGLSNRVFMLYNGAGEVSYGVTNFSVSGNGNIKLADLPEECQTTKPVYGIGTLSASGTVYHVLLLSTGSALYVHKTNDVPDGVVAGSTTNGVSPYALEVVNSSY